MVLGTLAAGVTASAAVAVGCGGDDNGTPSPQDGGGTDATTAPDSTPPGEDVVTPPMGDSAPPGKDAGPDVSTDAPTDAPVPPMDAPLGDAGDAGDAQSPLLAFPGQLAQALCNRLASCCFLGGDASAFDMNECLGSFTPFGYQGSSVNAGLLGNGHVAFDASAGASCISQINAIDCTANLRTSAQELAIRSACFGAFTGTLAAGSHCGAAIECGPGLFCTPGDGGASSGVCTPLRGTGQPCGDFGVDTATSENICSFRGSGNTGLTCHNEDYTTGDVFPDASTWQCQAQQTAGMGCNQNVDCTTALCDPGASQSTFTCATSEAFIYPFACANFLKDGG